MCYHGNREKVNDAETLVCRQGPPTPVLIPSMNMISQKPVMQIMPMQPPVPEDYWCGQFKEAELVEASD